MNIINTTQSRLTKAQAAELLGIKTYDTALPQPWLEEIAKNLSITSHSKSEVYDTILNSTVWAYDHKNLFGYPHPLTVKAYELLKENDKKFHTCYCDKDDKDI